MFRAILSFIIRSIYTVVTASGFIHVCRCRLTTTHVNKLKAVTTFRVCGSVHLQIFNKTTDQMHSLIFFALSRRHRSTCFGHCCAHQQEPPPTAVAASGYRVIAGLDVLQAVLEARPTRQSHGNQRLQRQLEGAPDDVHNSALNMLSGVYTTKQ
jgi:hypothetical protein